MSLKNLSTQEKSIMFQKATERAFTGEYDKTTETGIYICKNCGSSLYSHDGKFDSRCGWPSFDQEITGAVRRSPDLDGRRVEILCDHCGIHLGHVFEGENLTQKNTRHCVNSLSLLFVDAEKAGLKVPKASVILGCGCFWGVQYYFDKLPGVTRSQVGYSGGDSDNPNYRQVCSHQSGHREVILIDYDPEIIIFEDLIKYFFEIHNFSQTNGQGNDVGDQYKSVIYTSDTGEIEIIKSLIENLKSKSQSVATEVLPKKPFWTAELEHQDYYQNNGNLPYCHIHKKINW